LNKLPEIKFDDTIALWRRFIIIKFTKKFLGKRADKQLIKKLTLSKELSGLLNLLLKSLKRLNYRGFFKGDDTVLNARKDYILESDSIHAFCIWGLEENRGHQLSNKEFYEAYLKFCEFHNLEAKHKQTLSKDAPLHLLKLKTRSDGSVKYKIGYSVKEDFTIKIEEENY
jgi:phage/plasmid-associated DNA primase